MCFTKRQVDKAKTNCHTSNVNIGRRYKMKILDIVLIPPNAGELKLDLYN